MSFSNLDLHRETLSQKIKTKIKKLSVVEHTYNSSYLGSGGRRIKVRGWHVQKC
jgi:hypothetical protein